ncbi:MAG: DNA-processing protein DprA [Spirochaetaceae bacterium]|nr:DNA-processing protein DprA [Spirochaetaceae bacterium]
MNDSLLLLAINGVSCLGGYEKLALLERAADADAFCRLSFADVEELCGRRLPSRAWNPGALMEKAGLALRILRTRGIRILGYQDSAYPPQLREIFDPPFLLFCRGIVPAWDCASLAIVGTRYPSGAGRRAARETAREAAENGIIVVSGLARGIDAEAHRGCLHAGGKTIAVLGSGVDICSPASNKKLMEEIAETGLLISEYPPGAHATKYAFPQRNRIISGISEATVVVEAGLSSGALITAELAAEQGKEVYAVPGNIDSIYSIGTNKLIKDGALPLIVADDLLDDLGVKRNPAAYPQRELGKAEAEIIGHIETQGEVTVDYLCRRTGKQPPEINGIITVLEIKGMVYTFMGKIFVAK